MVEQAKHKNTDSSIDQIIERMRESEHLPAIFWKNKETSYGEIIKQIDIWCERLDEYSITPGTVCAVLGDYSPQSCALFFAMMRKKIIIVPFTYSIENELPEFIKIAGVQAMFSFDKDDSWNFSNIDKNEQNQLVTDFKKRQHSGLIVFSSGSTGKPKGILQDCENVALKFVKPRKGWRTVLFLMMDHFGGFNTFLSSFAYGGTAICLSERSLDSVCITIEKAKANLLPTTPTFLNLLIASGVYQHHDLSSVELITYGTEVMPENTLAKIKEVFPNAELKQTYGLSELGVLRSKSQSDDSPWVKIGGDGFEIKIVDRVLWVRSEANMVGYLNAPNPIDEDGWMCTGDYVETDGDYIRILGRKSEIINVGGQKVHPVEIENVLLELEEVSDVTVFGVSHPIMGQVVNAKISLIKKETDLSKVKEQLRQHCSS